MSTQTPDAAVGDPITITYQTGADTIASITKKIELLVVACDPRNLIGICDYEKPERDVFDKLVNFTYHTSLLRVKGGPQSEYAVIFSPETMDRMNGQVYVFRNETVKTFGFAAANAMAENLVTIYQVNEIPGRHENSRKFSSSNWRRSNGGRMGGHTGKTTKSPILSQLPISIILRLTTWRRARTTRCHGSFSTCKASARPFMRMPRPA